MFELIKTKFHKVIKALKEDENHPVEAEFVLGKKGVKYQHALVRFPMPEGYMLEYWWIRPGLDSPKCYINHPHLGEKDSIPFVEIEVRKYLEEK